jgi:hypothetical protein
MILPRAISNFQIVIADVKDDKNSELKDATEYYLALAYLKNNDYVPGDRVNECDT